MPGTVETWTTKDGEEIPIPRLKDDHLVNIAKMLIDNRQRTKSALYAAANRRAMALRFQGIRATVDDVIKGIAGTDPLYFVLTQNYSLFKELYLRDLVQKIPDKMIRMAIVEFFWENREHLEGPEDIDDILG